MILKTQGTPPKVCQLEEEEFNWRYKPLGIRAKICRDCQHDHQRTWYEDHRDQEKERVRRRRAKAFLYSYKLTHPCVSCGETDPDVLDFDHIKGKGATITQLVNEGASLERIKVEIALTQVLSSNCHRRKTARERRK